MCQALKEIKLEGKLEGKIEGQLQERANFIKTMLSLGYSQKEIENILKNMSSTEDNKTEI